MSALCRKIPAIGLVTATLASIYLTTACADENSDIQAQCNKDAKEYGIEPEQHDEYVTGCILSMGGTVAEDQTRVTQSEDAMEVMPSPEDMESSPAQ